MAAIAPVLFPEMQKRGAKPGDLVALLSATGAQTETDPALDRADHHRLGHRRLDRGAVHRRPAAGRRARHRALRRGLVALPGRGPQPRPALASKREIGRLCLVALPALALPFVIRAAVVEGVATATEVSTIGIVYAVLAGILIYRQFDWRRLRADAGRHRLAVGRDPLHHRLRHRRWPGA
jgi:TRAP-type mannitol/chloroaromatic compound transport system permease large subunit